MTDADVRLAFCTLLASYRNRVIDPASGSHSALLVPAENPLHDEIEVRTYNIFYCISSVRNNVCDNVSQEAYKEALLANALVEAEASRVEMVSYLCLKPISQW